MPIRLAPVGGDSIDRVFDRRRAGRSLGGRQPSLSAGWRAGCVGSGAEACWGARAQGRDRSPRAQPARRGSRHPACALARAPLRTGRGMPQRCVRPFRFAHRLSPACRRRATSSLPGPPVRVAPGAQRLRLRIRRCASSPCCTRGERPPDARCASHPGRSGAPGAEPGARRTGATRPTGSGGRRGRSGPGSSRDRFRSTARNRPAPRTRRSPCTSSR
jgi:hypothetical protein